MIHAFGDFELDEDLCVLRRAGAVVHVQPKVFEILMLLAKAAPRVVLKKEIRQRLWRDVAVGEASIWRVVQEARRALGDESQEIIVTVHSRGCRLTLPVVQQAAPSSRRVRSSNGSTPAEALPPKPATPPAEVPAYLSGATASLERARRGTGGLLWLGGDRGVGKTFALGEIGRRAEMTGAKVRQAHTRGRSDLPPFWIWREAFPELDAAFPQLTQGRATGAAQFALLDGVARYLLDLWTAKLHVVLLDDLHWADAASLQLLEFVVPSLGRAKIVVVATYHDASLKSEERTRALVAAMGHPSSIVVPIQPLSVAGIARLVETATGSAPPEEVAKAIFERSGGNPLYAHRILATDWGRKALASAAGAPVTTMDLTPDVIATIEQHLTEISAPGLELLTKAAVLGHALDVAKLGVVSGLTAAEVIARLDEAVRVRVLRRDRNGLRFAQRLVRDVLYKRLSTTERTQLHAEAAQKLLAHYGPAYELHLKELADHFARALPAGDVNRSIELSMRVAEQEAEAGQPLVAAHYWQLARRALAQLPGGDRRQLTAAAGLARAWQAAGREEEARQALADAAVLERALAKSE
jgi:DNA-binding winged helix-turn-helix (wHTH) protein